MTSVDLPEPETPVTQVKAPTGKATSMSRRLCMRAPRTVNHSSGRRRWPGRAMLLRPARKSPVSEAGSSMICARRALGDDAAAVLAGAGPHVDDVVGRAHGLLVVLDDDHGVAEVAQAQQRVDEAPVVALVQADAGLVEDVEHADQRRADLRGQADALRLAAAERGRGALQREVADADVVEEGEALADLLDDAAADEALGVGELRAPCRKPSASRTLISVKS